MADEENEIMTETSTETDELSGLEKAVASGNFDVDALLKELDFVIKISKGTKKTHKGRDLTNLNRALALKAQVYGLLKGNLPPPANDIELTPHQIENAEFVRDCLLIKWGLEGVKKISASEAVQKVLEKREKDKNNVIVNQSKGI